MRTRDLNFCLDLIKPKSSKFKSSVLILAQATEAKCFDVVTKTQIFWAVIPRYQKFFILCYIRSHPRVWEFSYFMGWSTVIPKYEENFLWKNIRTFCFFRLEARKCHPQNIKKKNFWKKYRSFLYLGLESSIPEI